MSSRLELTPAELDRLEDALEDLEFSPLPDGPPEDAVGARLVEFQELLQLSREAMPMEEVPAGILDGVLAEARQAAAATTPESKPFWSRFRLGVWLPGLAFAGSAALLLFMLIPTSSDAPSGVAAAPEQDERARDEQPAPEPELARLAQASKERNVGDAFGRDGAARGEGLAAADDPATAVDEKTIVAGREPEEAEANAEPESEPEPEPVVADEADALLEDKAAEAPERRRKAKKSGSRASSSTMPATPKSKPRPAKKGNSAPGAGSGSGLGSAGKKSSGSLPSAEPPPPAEKAKDTVDLWSIVLEGDAQRRAGNCGLATMRYAKARKSDVAKTRSRALAGEGLCAYMNGKTGKAQKLFKQARAASPGVDAFIDRELSRFDAAERAAEQTQTKD